MLLCQNSEEVHGQRKVGNLALKGWVNQLRLQCTTASTGSRFCSIVLCIWL